MYFYDISFEFSNGSISPPLGSGYNSRVKREQMLPSLAKKKKQARIEISDTSGIASISFSLFKD
jgi:hypothetical protein